ncbi:DUF3306 domain-containing protein [Polynucleobacter sp. MWH-UH2A]|uniref:DUF3306 domain-containing protein n=1 Tax=Polynucleobacter sp. MWH-UH2A TaxID=1855617 RepID=UPI001BFEABF4|nr:DUF3306 domain-containing protein [Polynucleobacter sp. MWH-UH2A]QWD63514.1 DUF3306 domain-containing protein [Polynucleobacter sp. MWH-UH2A]
MTEGFFSRWSRRKSGQEKELDLPDELAKQVPVSPASDSSSAVKVDAVDQAEPPATFEDVEKIDRFSPDFSAFMKPGVDPAVQQAALKKMFTDPHFNVMDGLDIYIDDYSKPDPLMPGMLERMVQSDMLNLFRKKPDAATAEGHKVQSADSPSNPENQALAAESKTDLTSTHIQRSNESTDSSDPLSELEQKKT